MAEIRVAKSAGFKPFAGARSRATSTGRRRMIKVGNSNRPALTAAATVWPESAITITQSCQRTTIHAQQRFVTAAKNHP